MNFCLSDLVPPLRWSDASSITLLAGQPDLPDAWWRSLPVHRVLEAIGPESLGELLTEIVLEHWPAAAVGDVLPALHVLDPDDADEPSVAIALHRAGSWAGLLAMTGRELADQPFIQARPVLNTLFTAVLSRLGRPRPTVVAEPEAYVAAAGAQVAEGSPEEAVAGHGLIADEAPAPVVEPVAASETAAETYEADAEPDASHEPVVEEAAALHAEAAHEEAPSFATEEPAAYEPEPVDVPAEPGLDHFEPEPAVAHHAEPEPVTQDAEPESTPDQDIEPEPVVAEHAEPEPDHFEPEPVVAEHVEPEPVPVVAEPEPVVAEESEPVVAEESEPVVAEAAEPVQDEPEAEAVPVVAEHAEPEPAGSGEGAGLLELIEAEFAGIDDQTWAVAQNRVLTDEPSAVDQLAKLFAVSPADITATEYELRTRLDQWLAGDAAAPYRAHLDELVRTVGADASKEQLLGAADWHARPIQAFDVPASQFVRATLALHARQPQVQHVPPQAQVPPHSAFGPPMADSPAGPPMFQAFQPATPAPSEPNGHAERPYQPLKDVSQTRRCFRQPDGRWWLRIDVTAEQLAGGECALPTGFAAYLGLSPGESRTVRSAAGELTMAWHGRPALTSVTQLLGDVGAKEGGHLFLTLSDEGVLRARHLPAASDGADRITKALRLVGYTAPGGTREQAARVIATRIGLTGTVPLPDLLARLRERGDRDLLELMD